MPKLFADLMTAWQRLADLYFSRVLPLDETKWHKWYVAGSVRLSNGKRSELGGQLWRRKTRYGYEYQQDAETEEEAFARWSA